MRANVILKPPLRRTLTGADTWRRLKDLEPASELIAAVRSILGDRSFVASKHLRRLGLCADAPQDDIPWLKSGGSQTTGVE